MYGVTLEVCIAEPESWEWDRPCWERARETSALVEGGGGRGGPPCWERARKKYALVEGGPPCWERVWCDKPVARVMPVGFKQKLCM